MVSVIRSIFQPSDKVSPQDLEKGLKAVILDGMCTQAMGVLTGGAFLVAFAIALGASNFHIGLLAAIPFLTQFLQLPAVYLVERVRARRGISVAFSGASRLLWLLIAAIPLLFAAYTGAGLYVVIVALALFAGLGAVAGTSWNSWMRDLIPEKILGSFFARRMILSTGLGIVLTVLAGFFVYFWKGRFPDDQLYGYSILFILGCAAGLVGLYFLSRTPEPKMEKQGEVPSLRELLTRPLKDTNFRRLLTFSVPWSFAINMAAPFFTVYLLVRLEYSLSTVVMLAVLSQLANLFFLRIWGRLSDRFNNKSILSVSGPLFLLCILAWPFTTMPEKYFLTLPLVIIIHIFSGISLAGVTLGTGNIALKLSPRGQATSYLAASGILNSLAAGVASLIGGIIGFFFATKELSLLFQWFEPARQIAIHTIDLRGLDFLFVIAFIIGLYSLHRLASIKEEGEVTERIVINELTAEVMQQMKSLSTVGGLRQFTSFPLYIARDSLRRLPQPRKRKKRDRGETPDVQ
ncbi:MAG TPA: MFS transporter [Dehalococcoidia bacterium]|nr:MFS transporter [Dehalococcoidia bacterium]